MIYKPNMSATFAAMYAIARFFLFFFDAEKVHHFAMSWLRKANGFFLTRRMLRGRYAANCPDEPVEVFGLPFRNPVGLAAGFDKNALYLEELAQLGFGHIEIGTVTPRAQEGNEKPRLFRLQEDKALINRMGFNNDGVEAVVERLREWRKSSPRSSLLVGGNIGKNKSTPNEDAYLDYDICYRKLYDYVDYFVVNVSSPNTPGLRELQEKGALKTILTHLQEIRLDKEVRKPLLLKIAPDLTNEQVQDVIDLAMEIRLDGLVAANTSISRNTLSDAGKIRAAEIGAGGLSGKPIRARATEIVQMICDKTNGEVPVIASGGIFTAADALEKIKAGASLVQVWTGFIYEGPSIVKNITRGVAEKRTSFS
jgi:dihydroorotate dehydrogenase